MISAYMMGAEKAIAIDRFPERLEMAKKFAKAEVINYEEVNAGETLKQITGGLGSNAVVLKDHQIFQQKKDNSIKVVLKL